MSENCPKSPADKRPNNKPYYIDQYCKKCGTTLVLYDLLENPNKPLDEIWYDEFICPNCQDGLYIDRPSQ
jgi:hypothetical protein